IVCQWVLSYVPLGKQRAVDPKSVFRPGRRQGFARRVESLGEMTVEFDEIRSWILPKIHGNKVENLPGFVLELLQPVSMEQADIFRNFILQHLVFRNTPSSEHARNGQRFVVTPSHSPHP